MLRSGLGKTASTVGHTIDCAAARRPWRVSALAGALVLCIAFGTSAYSLPTGAGPDGAARPWEGATSIGPYTQLNLRTGHVLTTLPVVGWGGRGPSIGFALYHNSNGKGTEPPPSGKEPTEPSAVSWRTSYSGFVKAAPTFAAVTHDDGTVDSYQQYKRTDEPKRNSCV